ncbi:MAG: hypothetical protein AAGD96_11385, partial [Chloroflexota bacterium]
PKDIVQLASILNGNAINDPNDPRVKAKTAVSYDYANVSVAWHWPLETEPTLAQFKASSGSALVIAIPIHLPANGTVPHVTEGEADRKPKKVEANQWVSGESKPPASFDSKSHASLNLNDSTKLARLPDSDFAVEAWVKPIGQRQPRQSLITGTHKSATDFALELSHSKDEIAGNALFLGDLNIPKNQFTVPKLQLEKTSFSIGLWVHFTAEKEYKSAKIYSDNDNFSIAFTLQYISVEIATKSIFEADTHQPFSYGWNFLAVNVNYDKDHTKRSADCFVNGVKISSKSPGIGTGSELKVKKLTLDTADHGHFKSIAIWNRSLNSKEIDEIYLSHRIDPNNKGLLSLYTFDNIDPSAPKTVPNASTSKAAKTEWAGQLPDAKLVQKDSSENLFVHFRSTPYSIMSQQAHVLNNQWNHIAAVCTNNIALAFSSDAKHKGICTQGNDIELGEAFSFDALIKVNQTTGKRYLFSKLDDQGNGFTLNINNGFLQFEFTLVDKHRSASEKSTYAAFNSQKLESGKSYYIAIGGSLELTTQPLKVPEGGDKLDALVKALNKGFGENQRVTHLRIFAYIHDISTPVKPFYPEHSFLKISNPNMGTSYKKNTRTLKGEWHFQEAGDLPIYLGCQSETQAGYFDGEIGMLRMWERDISSELGQLAQSAALPHGIKPPMIEWRFDQGSGKTAPDTEGSNSFQLDSVYMWQTSGLTAELDLYINGRRAHSESISHNEDAKPVNEQLIFGALANKGNSSTSYTDHFVGQMSEVRLWKSGRTAEEIADNLFARANGSETDLLACWPLMGNTKEIADSTMELVNQGITFSNEKASDPVLPLLTADMPIFMPIIQSHEKITEHTTGWSSTGKGAASAAEYGDLQTDENGEVHGVLKRSYGFVDGKKCVLVTGFKVGELDTHYLGQVQTKPQLIGYIEGAPPLPSENLNRPYYNSTYAYQSYAGASSIELVEADHTIRSFSADKDIGLKRNHELAFGPEIKSKLSAGFGSYIGFFETSSKPYSLRTTLNLSTNWQKDATTTNGSTKTISNRFEASGDWKDTDFNPTIGKRYVPDNVGYALVKSRVANLYALRLSTTGALISLSIVPDPDIPEDFNLITFQINNKYTKQGTLDGMIGLVADPDLKLSKSYYKPKEAYDLLAKIEAQEKQLNADYESFDARKKGFSVGSSPKDSVNYGASDAEKWHKQHKNRSMVNSYVWTASSGFFAEEEQTTISRQESMGGSFNIDFSLQTSAEFSLSPGIFLDGNALFGADLHTTVTKSKEEGRSYELKVEVGGEGFLSSWEDAKKNKSSGKIEKPAGYSSSPTAGKVTAYRFKTFYLAPERDAFDTFFEEVVDSMWLDSNDPEAIALKEAKSRPNQVWRVLHRVTYVSRATGVYDTESAIPKSRIKDEVTLSMPAIDLAGNRFLLGLVAEHLNQKDSFDQAILKSIESISGKTWDKFKTASNNKAEAQRLKRAGFQYLKTLGEDYFKHHYEKNKSA